jgi:cytochrome c5
MARVKQKTAIWGLTIFLLQSLFIVSDVFAADSGEAVYNGTCIMCHKSGAMGAPRFGNGADWNPRIAQGKKVLYSHAIGGFKGKKGRMPPRGGKPKLTDAEVKAAVDYMVGAAK